MTTRCIIRNLLLSSATLAIAVWPSFSQATTVNVLTWTDSTTGLNLNGGALNLTNNALVINASDPAAAQAAYNYLNTQLGLGYNDTLWTGNNGPSDAQGVYSDSSPFNTGSTTFPSAATDNFAITGLGVVKNSDEGYTSWNGVTVGPNSVLVGFTYNGDTDMDGIIENYDVNDTLQAFLLGPSFGTGWINGNSSYSPDGSVTKQDVNNVLQAFLLQTDDQLVVPTNPSASVASGFASPVGVPEPSSLALLLVAAVGVLLYSRRMVIGASA